MNPSVALNEQHKYTGAEFKEINNIPTYFQVDPTYTVIAPWLGQNAEATFMNRTKELDQPPVRTYVDYQMSSIPQLDYGEYKTDDDDENSHDSHGSLMNIPVSHVPQEGRKRKRDEEIDYANIILIILIVLCTYLLFCTG